MRRKSFQGDARTTGADINAAIREAAGRPVADAPPTPESAPTARDARNQFNAAIRAAAGRGPDDDEAA